MRIALAMVMAHELAHLKYRHASAALGRGVAAGVILSVVSAEACPRAASGWLSQAVWQRCCRSIATWEREADEGPAVPPGHGQLGLVARWRSSFVYWCNERAAGGESSGATVEFLPDSSVNGKPH